MLFKNYSIATRIGGVVGVILLMMLVLAIVEVKGLNSIKDSLDNIVGKHFQRLQVAQDMRFLARDGAVLVRNILLVPGVEQKNHERSRFEECAQKYMSFQEQLLRPAQTEDEKKILQAVIRSGEITFSIWRTITTADSSNSPEEGMKILQAEVRNHQWGLLDSLDILVKMERELAEVAMEKARNNYIKTKSVMAMINILAIGAGLFSVAAITAGIVGPLGEISRKVDKIAGGDFTTRIELDQEDEVGQLAGHINRMVEKLDANEEELEKYRYHLEELIEWRTGEINDQRERFISVLIHDLKGPLVPIIGFSRLLTTREHLTEEKITRYAREVYEATTKLATIIDQTSRSLREKRLSLSFDKEPFDVEDLIYSVSRNCQPAMKAANITLKLNDQDLSGYQKRRGTIMYSGDIGKLRSLLENLLGNAGKYAKSRIDIYLRRNGERITLMVDDDGCGVAEPFRKKIFEEYYQAPGSRDGTGVGLYSAKRIVDHYQGIIAVESSPLGGARFVVSLPLS